MLLPLLIRVLYMGLMFVVGMVLANKLAPASFGSLALMQLNAALLVFATGLGIEGWAQHAMAQKKWTLHEGAGTLFLYAIIQVLLCVALQLISLELWGHTLLVAGDTQQLPTEVLYFSGLVFTDKLLVLFYQQQKERVFNGVLALSTALYLLLLFAWDGIINLPGGLMFSWSLFHVSQALLLLFVLLGWYGVQKWRFLEFKAWKVFLRSSILITAANLVQLVAYRVDFWMLGNLAGKGELGLYAQACRFAALLWIVPNIMGPMLFTRFNRYSKEDLVSLFRLCIIVHSVVMVGAGLLAWLSYQYFLLPAFFPGFKALALMLPGYWCWALVINIGSWFSFKGMFRADLAVAFSSLVLILGLDVLLIPAYGMYGAAIANTLAYGTMLLLILAYGWRKKLFTFQQLLKPRLQWHLFRDFFLKT